MSSSLYQFDIVDIAILTTLIRYRDYIADIVIVSTCRQRPYRNVNNVDTIPRLYRVYIVIISI